MKNNSKGGDDVNNELYHHGIKGMKWGVRRYEDKTGHLTPAGKKRYKDYGDGRLFKRNLCAGIKVRGGSCD